MSNRLAAETSPYLLQHRENPVDWYPWGPEALGRAREEDLPILLSVGYSACHWCHVMERESFEDPEIAAYMNEHFVCVKVDREERPDVDSLYMEAVQAITGRGGWPMTVFLDPDGVPFHGGTYFPPEPAHGMPSFRMIMEAVVASFELRREEIRERAADTRHRLGVSVHLTPAPDALGPELLVDAAKAMLESVDPENGGFGGAPKFPPASALDFLLARREAEITTLTLDAMASGGIYDQLGGGFSRYSVDAHWLVPHFEKMLYDNALLARLYLHGWQNSGLPRHRRICEETLDWCLAEMRGPEGAFYSALDADSEGVEGRYYVWTATEIRELLGERAEALIAHFGVTEAGNFDGASVLHLPGRFGDGEPSDFKELRETLLEARAKRVRPGLDDKRVTSWNALIISALSEAGAVLGRQDYLDAAGTCADFILTEMRNEAGHLLRTFNRGEARLNAYLEDYAFLLEALLQLYESTFERRWFDSARGMADQMIDRFGDLENGGFFSTSNDHEELIARRKEIGDHPIPGGNSSAALGLLRLAALTGERFYEEQAVGVLRLFARTALRHPDSFGHMLQAIDFHVSPTREVALIGDQLSPLAGVVRESFRPHLVTAGGPAGSTVPELLAGREPVDRAAAAYVCENFTCRMPITNPEEFRRALDGDNR